MRQLLTSIILSCFCFSCAPTQPEESWESALATEIQPAWSDPMHRGFDFGIGEWGASWRARPDDDFYNFGEGFSSHERIFPVLDGKAIIAFSWNEAESDKIARSSLSLRYFDPIRERWVSVSNSARKSFQSDGFAAQMIGDGRPGSQVLYSTVRVFRGDGKAETHFRRANYSELVPGKSFRWDGATTGDGGENWHTWRIVDLMREGDVGPLGGAGEALPGVENEGLCKQTPHAAFNSLQGVWEGEASDGLGRETAVKFSAGKILNGCGVLGVLETEKGRSVITFGYSEKYSHWISLVLDDSLWSGHSYFVSNSSDSGAIFEEAKDLAIKDEHTVFLEEKSFDTSQALERKVLQKITAQEIIVRDEVRVRSNAPWKVATTYCLSRK